MCMSVNQIFHFDLLLMTQFEQIDVMYAYVSKLDSNYNVKFNNDWMCNS